MGEASRKKLAGNTESDLKWKRRITSREKHAQRAERQLKAYQNIVDAMNEVNKQYDLKYGK